MIYCGVLQCVAVCCRGHLYNVLQCVAVRCSVLQCVAGGIHIMRCCMLHEGDFYRRLIPKLSHVEWYIFSCMRISY